PGADLLEERRDTATGLPTMQRVAILTSLLLILVAVSSVGLHGAAGAQEEKGKTAPVTQTFTKEQAPPAGTDKPAESAPAGKVTGRVVHAADGQPVTGADVRLVRRGT